MSSTRSARRAECGSRARRRGPDALRPSDLVTVFFAVGIVYLMAGVAVALINATIGLGYRGSWLAIHLVFLGGVSQLILGAAQFFAGAFLATNPPPKALVRAQLITWNTGVVLVAIGGYGWWGWLLGAGAVLVVLGLCLFALGLHTMKQRSLQRMPWATRWYFTSTCMLVAGAGIGVLLANRVTISGAELLTVHIVLNVVGWFGTTIIGTLHTFFPSLTGTVLRYPRLQLYTFISWIAGTAAISVGYLLGLSMAALAGWGFLLLATAFLIANLIGSLRAATEPIKYPAGIVALAQSFLFVALVVISVRTVTAVELAAVFTGSTRAAVSVLLLAGWIGLTVLGSLVHLLRVVRRVRNLKKRWPEGENSKVSRALIPLVAVAVPTLALGVGLDEQELAVTGAVMALAIYSVLGLRVLRLATQALRTAKVRL